MDLDPLGLGDAVLFDRRCGLWKEKTEWRPLKFELFYKKMSQS